MITNHIINVAISTIIHHPITTIKLFPMTLLTLLMLLSLVTLDSVSEGMDNKKFLFLVVKIADEPCRCLPNALDQIFITDAMSSAAICNHRHLSTIIASYSYIHDCSPKRCCPMHLIQFLTHPPLILLFPRNTCSTYLSSLSLFRDLVSKPKSLFQYDTTSKFLPFLLQ